MVEKVAKAAADNTSKVADPDAVAVATGTLLRSRLDLQSSRRPTKHGLPTPPRGPPVAAYSIPEFCYCHGISQAQYFAMKNRGEGPVEMHVGRRRLISIEAAAEWRRAREAQAVSGDQI